MKLSSSLIYVTIFLSFLFIDSIAAMFLKNEIDQALLSKKSEYVFDLDFKMPPGPIFAKGWLKYASYEIEEKSRPREFFKNFGFYEQFKNSETLNLNAKDNVSYLIIT